MPLKSSIEKGIDEPLYSRWYSGNCFHRSNSASHSASLRGHRLPCGRQSVIDRPDLVSRVMPPTTTMQNTEPLLTSSHHPTARSTVWAAGAATADATASATLPAPTPGIDNVERPRRASESSGWLDDALAPSSRGSALVDALAPASSRGSAGSALARATRAAWSSIGKERRAAAQEEAPSGERFGDQQNVPVWEKKSSRRQLPPIGQCFLHFSPSTTHLFLRETATKRSIRLGDAHQRHVCALQRDDALAAAFS